MIPIRISQDPSGIFDDACDRFLYDMIDNHVSEDEVDTELSDFCTILPKAERIAPQGNGRAAMVYALRNLLISLRGGSPNMRLYSRLNCWTFS